MTTIWRWFYRSVVAIGICFLALAILVNIAPNRPLVSQSNGFIGPTPEAIDATISGTLPGSAADVRYGRSSVGLGGRFRIYRFSASIDELHTHAIAEFDAHWDRPGYVRTNDVPSPFTEEDAKLFSEYYRVNTEWMISPKDATGTIYESADGQSSYRPTVFVDETNGVLYFQMTD